MQGINVYFKLVNYIPLVIIGSFILILVLGIVFLRPKFSELGDLRDKIDAKEIELQYKEEYFAKLAELKLKLDASETEISKVDSALPDDSYIPSIFKFIQETASVSGIFLREIDPFSVGYLDGSDRIKEISFSVKLSGTYPTFNEFLSAMEKSARLFEVRNISFKENKETGDLDFQVNIRTFSY